VNARGNIISAIDFRDFARGLAFNRSIQKLSITGWDYTNQDPFPETWDHLTRFFIGNEALYNLEFDLHCPLQRETLVSSLRRFDSLKEFKLSSQHSRSLGVSVDEVIDALIGQHTGLRKLTIDGFYIGRGGCAALATSPLTELYLMCCKRIDDEGARAFATGLASNTTLKVLKIDNERCIAKNICQSFTTCKVESLILFATPLTDATMLTLSNALLHNSTLKSLSLNSNFERHRELTNSGWTALSISLRVIALEELSILGNSLDDIGITVIAESLENNSSLRELDLSDNLICEDGVSALCNVLRHPNSVLKILDIRNNSIRDIGVMALSTVLRHPNSKLERLDISDNVIGDIGINALTDALINNSMLKELTIEENPDVTPAGWMNFAAVLRNPTSALEFIEASHDSINDEVVHTFADALSENKTLEELYLGICPPWIQL
jgi:Ran GTPase-activating protein (RanGAP) involved in mRNA processing and transport